MPFSLPPAPGPSTLAERLADDMRQRWRDGERPRTEDYLARYPALWDHAEAAAELIYEELCLCREHGEATASSEVLRRFPQWATQFRVLLDCHRALEEAWRAPDFPAPGDALGEFRLLGELGRGSQGRVFLAAEPALDDRPVVLKLTPRTGSEHLALARLQHTHIVPLYSVSEDPGRGLRVLCLPYFGGTTLAALLKALRDRPPEQRTGADLLRALDEAQASVFANPSSPPLSPEERGVTKKGPARDWLARASYVEAICWVGACLASALHHAHERGLLHLDLKPSNVLLAADGTPMLLDFHLARPPLAAGATAPPWLGGTPAYLSPEQAAAMSAVRQGRPIPAAVDSRSDVFSLGLVLYEALAGALPTTTAPQSLRLHNSRVSVGLVDLVARCLEPRACDRYPDAAVLADDLRRHLADQPLRGVVNRDPRERWRKWRRRRPFALALIGLLLVAVGAAVLVVDHVVRQLHKAQAALEEGRANLHQQQYTEATASLRRGLVLAEDLPLSGGLAEELTGALRLAQRGEAARDLHLAAERIRGVYGAGSLPRNELRAVERSCRDLWERRGRITEILGAGLPPDVEQRVKNDLLELSLLAATLRVALARPGEENAARREALAMLAEVEAMLGPSPVLFHERGLLAEAQSLKNLAHETHSRLSQAPARTAWEHYALGCSWLRHGKLERAAQELEQAVELAPQDLWANFSRGKCAYQRGRPAEALVAFAACVALAPGSASCFYNRGLAHEALGHAEALRDYDRALRLDPGLAAASLSRGLLHVRAGRADEAAADLQAALSGGAEPASAHYGLALVYLARCDRAAALLSLDRALRFDPTHKQARELHDSLRPPR